MTRLLIATAVIAAAVLAAVDTAQASCIAQTAAEQRARADVIFDGVALDGPRATGVQRFRVSNYRKGRGPMTVRVQTGHKIVGGTGSTTSVAIVVGKGQRWRIFARGSAQRVLQTNVCDGSRRL